MACRFARPPAHKFTMAYFHKSRNLAFRKAARTRLPAITSGLAQIWMSDREALARLDGALAEWF